MQAKGMSRLLATAVAAVVVSGGLVVGASAASAEVVGALAITPASGTNLTGMSVSMSKPCPGGTNLFVRLFGPGFPAAGYNVVANSTQASYPTNPDGGRNVVLSNHFQAFADDQAPPATLAGQFRLLLTCRNSLTLGGPAGTGHGDFEGTLTFNSPTAYTADAGADHRTTTTVSVLPAGPKLAGTQLTFTANVVARTPPLSAGTVQFRYGATDLGTPIAVDVDAATSLTGAATLQTDALPTGAHEITAVYLPAAGGSSLTSTSGPVSYTVIAPPTQTTTVLSSSPTGTAAAGSPVTFTAALTPATAVGLVQFKLAGAALGASVSVASGSATLTTSLLPAGTHSVTAEFTPTDPAAFTPSVAGALAFVVTGDPALDTTTSLSSSVPSPQAAATAVTFTAVVTPTAAGTVQFKDGTTPIGTAQTVVSGSAGLTISTLAVGTHSITAHFSPADPVDFNASQSAPLDYVITGAPAVATATTLVASAPSPQVDGTSVTFTAVVSAGAVGTVQFKNGGVNVGGPVALTGPSATFTSSTLPVGTNVITAEFTPTNAFDFTASTSLPMNYVITVKIAVETTTSLGASPATMQSIGNPVTLTATVAGAGAAGTVQFSDGVDTIGAPVQVVGGAASITTSDRATGTRSFAATFLPASAADFTTSTSTPALAYTITVPVVTVTSLAVSPPGGSSAGASVTLTATVTPAAEGNVQFKDGTASLGSAPVAAGVATLSTTALTTVGTRSLTAIFTPLQNALFHTRSTSAAVAHAVTAASLATTTTVAASPASPKPAGTAVTFAASVSVTGGGSPIGAVQFTDGTAALGAPVALNAGSASLTTTTLAVGAHSIKAAFVPTSAASFVGSTSTALNFTINAASAAATTRPPTTTTTTTTPTAPPPAAPPVTAPGNLLKPAVVGAGRVGTPALCKGDTWTGSPKVTFSWLRNGKPIVGAATGRYRVAAIDLGKKLSCVATATNPAGTVVATSVGRLILSGKFVSVVPPVLLGKVKAGQKLTVVVGPWGDTERITVRYQWRRDGVVIRGAGAAQYLVRAADVGRSLVVRITISRPGFISVSTSSVLVLGEQPKIVGKLSAGQVLSVRLGVATPKPTSFAYQWFRNGRPIAKAGGASYRLVALDKGAKITVRVIAKRGRVVVASMTTVAVAVARK